MTTYNKLVRDRIPEIIERSGSSCETRVLNDEEFIAHLHSKLQEEFREYEESQEVEELDDVLEVIFAIATHRGTDPAGLEEIRLAKRNSRGGFDKKLLLVRTTD